MPKCRICGREAWVKLPWTNTWFCREHFIEYFERKVYKTFKKYVPRIHRKLLFAVSGGKDSMAMLYSLAPRLVNEGFEVAILFIDLGIRGYSEYARKVVEKASKELGLELHVLDLGKEYGFTIDYVAQLTRSKKLGKPVCSVCGVVKRYLYNYYAYRHGFDLVLTGHTLNDIYAFIQSDLTTGGLEELIKLKPYIPASNGFVAKARPLYFNYDYENRLYTIAKDIDVVLHNCPHAPVRESSLVTSYKKTLIELERKHPGIGVMYVKNTLKNIIDKLELKEESKTITRCSICGMPSSSDPCSFCKLRISITGKTEVKTNKLSYNL
ncbi:MAG: ATP-binding protein [Thermoprotei archaeon]